MSIPLNDTVKSYFNSIRIIEIDTLSDLLPLYVGKKLYVKDVNAWFTSKYDSINNLVWFPINFRVNMKSI
jgi:hypothetical protein